MTNLSKPNKSFLAEIFTTVLQEAAAHVAATQIVAIMEKQGVSPIFVARQGVAVLAAAVIATVKKTPGLSTTQIGDTLELNLIDEHNNFVRSVLVLLEAQQQLRSEKEGTERKWYINQDFG